MWDLFKIHKTKSKIRIKQFRLIDWMCKYYKSLVFKPHYKKEDKIKKFPQKLISMWLPQYLPAWERFQFSTANSFQVHPLHTDPMELNHPHRPRPWPRSFFPTLSPPSSPPSATRTGASPAPPSPPNHDPPRSNSSPSSPTRTAASRPRATPRSTPRSSKPSMRWPRRAKAPWPPGMRCRRRGGCCGQRRRSSSSSSRRLPCSEPKRVTCCRS